MEWKSEISHHDWALEWCVRTQIRIGHTLTASSFLQNRRNFFIIFLEVQPGGLIAIRSICTNSWAFGYKYILRAANAPVIQPWNDQHWAAVIQVPESYDVGNFTVQISCCHLIEKQAFNTMRVKPPSKIIFHIFSADHKYMTFINTNLCETSMWISCVLPWKIHNQHEHVSVHSFRAFSHRELNILWDRNLGVDELNSLKFIDSFVLVVSWKKLNLRIFARHFSDSHSDDEWNDLTWPIFVWWL